METMPNTPQPMPPQEPEKLVPEKKKRFSLALPWRFALAAAGIVALLLGAVQLWYMLADEGAGALALGGGIYLAACLLIGALGALLFALLRRIPALVFGVFLAGLLLMVTMLGGMTYGLLLMLLAALCAFLLCQWKSGAWKGRRKFGRILRYISAVLCIVMFTGTLFMFAWPGTGGMPPVQWDATVAPEGLANPGAPGAYAWTTYYYGPKGQKVEPYPGETMIEAPSANLSSLVYGWSGVRTWRYGFDPSALPLNGTVWMPQGEGPFPLVLIVHGNHLASDRSDGGYAYLGELLASQGMIAVSVDENFLNSSFFCDILIFNGLEGENDARAVVLMKHLELWATWAQTAGHPFYAKADMDNVALIGHSRGGEAASLAAAFSKTGHHPENGNLIFSTPYTVRSVAAIAPVDGQYMPAGHALVLEDVNYLVLHGTHDMDVNDFVGADTYRRALPPKDGFKALVYMQYANHGQFNSSWGNADGIGLGNMAFRRRQLMPMEEQQRAAKVYIGGFLQATLLQKSAYKAMFWNAEALGAWLPPTQYVTDFAAGDDLMLATFEEDIDLTSATAAGITLQAQGTATWQERRLPAKWESADNHVLSLRWEEDGIFGMALGAGAPAVSAQDMLCFSMAWASDPEEAGSVELRVTDEQGNVAQMPLDAFGAPSLPLEAQMFKISYLTGASEAQPVLQGILVGLDKFAGIEGEIVHVELLLHGKGHLYVDDIRVVAA